MAHNDQAALPPSIKVSQKVLDFLRSVDNLDYYMKVLAEAQDIVRVDSPMIPKSHGSAQHHHRTGAEGIIVGYMEIGLLISERDCRVPIFDTTRIHAEAAAEFALREEG
jgi:hypothetical protein